MIFIRAAWIVLIFIPNTKGMATLTLPTSANCGNQAVLTCTSTDCYQGYMFAKNGVIIYNHVGPLGDFDPGKYNGTVTSNSTVKLTITNMQLSDLGAYVCVCGFDNPSTSQTMQYSCMATLTLPTSANCGDQAVLTCTSIDCNQAYRFLKNGVIIYNHVGPLGDFGPGKYNGTVTSNSTVKLTITNIQLSDGGAYVCSCGFNNPSTSQTMQYICKATTSNATITNDKKLSIIVDSLYPQPSRVDTSLTSLSTRLSGTYECWPSSLLASHYRCTWVSTASLPDGNYGYTMTVTTGSDAAPVNGTFRIDITMSSTSTATVAGSVVGGIVVLAAIGFGIFLYRRYECSIKLKQNEPKLSNDVPMTDRRNIYESAVPARDSAHVYSQLHQPEIMSGDQHRLNNTGLYESPLSLTSPEHVYSVLSAPAKENLYANQKV